MNKSQKILNIMSFGSIILGFLTLGLIFFWTIFPYKPLAINNHPYPILNEEPIKAGGYVAFMMDYCKYTDEPSVISRRFVDGLIHVLPDVKGVNEAGCRKSIIIEDVPENLPAGEYVMQFTYSYRVNPIRTINIQAHTQSFEVVK